MQKHNDSATKKRTTTSLQLRWLSTGYIEFLCIEQLTGSSCSDQQVSQKFGVGGNQSPNNQSLNNFEAGKGLQSAVSLQ